MIRQPATQQMVKDMLDGTTPVSQADRAAYATKDGIGNNIAETYAKQGGIYPNMTAGEATTATKATQDGDGNVIADTYATKGELDAGLQKLYPIGSIYLSANGTNPATLFGFGTWQAWGAGRVPVGVDASQTEFDAAEKTGGEKVHTLTISEMPEHNHFVYRNAEGESVDDVYIFMRDTAFEESPYQAGSTSDIEGLSTAYRGGGAAHNNLQPYITCYMWKRVS